MRVFFILVCAFIALPWLELYVLLRIGAAIGAGNTLLLIVLTGLVGAGLARWQGFLVLTRMRDEMRQGSVPALDLVDGVLILCAALLLVTPGLISDTVGFLLLVPRARSLIRAGLLKWFRNRFVTRADVHLGDPRAGRPRHDHDPDVIEVTARDVADDDL